MGKEINIKSLRGIIPDHTLKMYEKNILSSAIDIKSMTVCTGTTVVAQGLERLVRITPSGGKPPYPKLELIIDDIVVKTLTSTTGGYTSAQDTIYNFPQAIGNHRLKSAATDSCLPAQRTIGTECTFDVVNQCPALSVTSLTIDGVVCPTAAISYTGNHIFAATITGGMLPLTYVWNMDGTQVATTATLTSTGLSSGSHTVSLTVTDNCIYPSKKSATVSCTFTVVCPTIGVTTSII
jgi:hypothetical protein